MAYTDSRNAKTTSGLPGRRARERDMSVCVCAAAAATASTVAAAAVACPLRTRAIANAQICGSTKAQTNYTNNTIQTNTQTHTHTAQTCWHACAQQKESTHFLCLRRGRANPMRTALGLCLETHHRVLRGEATHRHTR